MQSFETKPSSPAKTDFVSPSRAFIQKIIQDDPGKINELVHCSLLHIVPVYFYSVTFQTKETVILQSAKRSPLYIAASQGWTDVVTELLENGALHKIESPPCLIADSQSAVQDYNCTIAKHPSFLPSSPLCAAVQGLHLPVVDSLLKQKMGDPTVAFCSLIESYNPIKLRYHHSTLSGLQTNEVRLEIAKKLIAAGANVHAVFLQKSPDNRTTGFYHLLADAIRYSDKEMVRWLLENINDVEILESTIQASLRDKTAPFNQLFKNDDLDSALVILELFVNKLNLLYNKKLKEAELKAKTDKEAKFNDDKLKAKEALRLIHPFNPNMSLDPSRAHEVYENFLEAMVGKPTKVGSIAEEIAKNKTKLSQTIDRILLLFTLHRPHHSHSTYSKMVELLFKEGALPDRAMASAIFEGNDLIFFEALHRGGKLTIDLQLLRLCQKLNFEKLNNPTAAYENYHNIFHYMDGFFIKFIDDMLDNLKSYPQATHSTFVTNTSERSSLEIVKNFIRILEQFKKENIAAHLSYQSIFKDDPGYHRPLRELIVQFREELAACQNKEIFKNFSQFLGIKPEEDYTDEKFFNSINRYINNTNELQFSSKGSEETKTMK